MTMVNSGLKDLTIAWCNFCTQKIFLFRWWRKAFCQHSFQLLGRLIILFKFSPSWSCVSLPRSTTSTEWKLLKFANLNNPFSFSISSYKTDYKRLYSRSVLKGFNPYSAGIEFSRQNLTSVDVRFWRLRSIPAL